MNLQFTVISVFILGIRIDKPEQSVESSQMPSDQSLHFLPRNKQFFNIWKARKQTLAL